ncbi:MAG: MATE family efflux transporter [Fimbriimonadaceae bacterium]|nr:MATE family efflux transporter [Alphaproteobacteria bacterium]
MTSQARCAPIPPAKFVAGSTMRHVIIMTLTSSVGLMAVFSVDLANLFYISLLGETELAAAIGYAGTVFFFNISICIGIMIAGSALVARALGAGDMKHGRRVATSNILFMLIVTALLTALLLPLLGWILDILGATGRTHEVARKFLLIVVPSLPLLGTGMCLSGFLRAVGDARRAMYVMLAGGLTTAILDPILIFGLDLGVEGAAIASVISRAMILALGIYGVVRVHHLLDRPDLTQLTSHLRPFLAIAVPAVLTNIATPFGNAYVTSSIAPYGDAAVAAWAIIGRLIPFAFGVIFALSGTVGPILAQNLGAGRIDRVKRAFSDALIFTTLYVLTMWGFLWLFQNQIIRMFGAENTAAEIISFFCTWVAGSFLFFGALFISNAAFNNLGFPAYSTFFNWGRATLGTIPFIYLGSAWYGAPGVIGGHGLGAVVFGIAAILVCYRKIESIKPTDHAEPIVPVPRSALSPFTTGKGGTAG